MRLGHRLLRYSSEARLLPAAVRYRRTRIGLRGLGASTSRAVAVFEQEEALDCIGIADRPPVPAGEVVGFDVAPLGTAPGSGSRHRGHEGPALGHPPRRTNSPARLF